MPRDGRVDWYWLALVVGTAIVAFSIGSASTVWWLAGAPLSGKVLMQPGGGEVSTTSAGSPAATGLGTFAGAPLATPPAPGSNEPAAPATQSTAAAVSGSAGSASGPIATGTKPGQATGSVSGSVHAASSTAAAADAQSANAPQAGSPAPPASGSSPAAAAQGGNFSLQLGAFLDAANAKLLAGRLTSAGYAPMAVAAPDGNGHVWHYVRLGAFADEQAASLSAAELLERTGIAAVVVRGSAASAGG
jgi:cell division septation protein DedD